MDINKLKEYLEEGTIRDRELITIINGEDFQTLPLVLRTSTIKMSKALKMYNNRLHDVITLIEGVE